MSENQNQSPAKKPAESDTVTIRVKTGRVLLERAVVGNYANNEPIYEERWLEVGETGRVPRAWAEKMCKRTLEGYPGIAPNTVGQDARTFLDSPVEILDDRRAAA